MREPLGRELDGKVAVVVGGSGGIGAATCRLLAGQGARVVVGYRSNAQAATALAGDLPGEGHLALPVGVTDTASIEAFRDAVLSAIGRVDILVNSAGTTTPVQKATSRRPRLASGPPAMSRASRRVSPPST